MAKRLKEYFPMIREREEDGKKYKCYKRCEWESTGSNYTAKLKGALAKAKANAAQRITEMLEIAEKNDFGRILRKSMIKCQIWMVSV